jgi:hypothetical protein
MKELGTDSHLVELIVNHVSGTRAAVAGTYDKSERLAERRVALQRWADYLTAEPAPKVVDFAAARSA